MAFALNHMTVPGLRFDAVLALAKRLGCMGVEFRNDLGGLLFDGVDPHDVRRLSKAQGVSVLALAEVKAFNHVTDDMLDYARSLMEIAARCGAEAISLIPRNDGERLGAKERRDDLRFALRELAPILEEFDLIGLVEPLGFESCALRQKSVVIEEIVAASSLDRFKIIHDTFHHHLAGGGAVFPAETGLVHVSGVVAPIDPAQMTDDHRVLVDQNDRLGTITQLQALRAGGFDGPISMEAFASSVHDLSDPEAELLRSFNFIGQCLAEKAA